MITPVVEPMRAQRGGGDPALYAESLGAYGPTTNTVDAP